MTLEGICQQLISYIARIFFLARCNKQLDAETLRNTILNKFDRVDELVAGNPPLKQQLNNVKLPLFFFIDYIVNEGPFNYKGQWTNISYELGELAGDEKFFDILRQTLNDPSDNAAERLKVLYDCIGAGFNGCLSDTPKQLEQVLKECAKRLGIDKAEATSTKLFDSNYNVFNTPLKREQKYKLSKMIMKCSIIFLLLALMSNSFLFYYGTLPFRDTLVRPLKYIISDTARESMINNSVKFTLLNATKDKTRKVHFVEKTNQKKAKYKLEIKENPKPSEPELKIREKSNSIKSKLRVKGN